MHAHLVTNNEKREAVRKFLLQPAASDLSSRQIARRIGCSHVLVCEMRARMAGQLTYKEKTELRRVKKRIELLKPILQKLDGGERELLLSLLNIKPGA